MFGCISDTEGKTQLWACLVVSNKCCNVLLHMDTITFDDNAHDNMFVLKIGKEVTIWRAFAQ